MRRRWFLIMLAGLLLPLAGCLTQEHSRPTPGEASGFGFLIDPSSELVSFVAVPGQHLTTAADDPRTLIPDVDLEMADFSYSFQPGNTFIIDASFTNITAIHDFHRPFYFVANEQTDNIVSSTEPEVTDADLGGDGILSPGETTSLLRFEVIHRNEEFTYFVDAYAVVPSLPARGVTERVSVDSNGVQGNRQSYGPTLSANGRFVAFTSEASNLVPGDVDIDWDWDVFVHDQQTGETELVSMSSTGVKGNGPSSEPSISADGRFVAFSSEADNLVPEDTNDTRDVFVRDRDTGTTERVSVDSFGNEALGIRANGRSGQPSISADGRFVAFDSWASNLVPDDTNDWMDVFVHDRDTGTTERVSVDSFGNEGNSYSRLEMGGNTISADGRFVVFDSYATNLVPGDVIGNEIYVHDRDTGLTERACVDSQGNSPSYGSCLGPSISADGRFVSFYSNAPDLVPNAGYDEDIFVHDRHTGVTEIVSVDSNGIQGNGSSYYASLSADGRFVAFHSHASNLVPGDTYNTRDVFVHDRDTGSTERVSVDNRGYPGNAGSGPIPAISADGRFVAFGSDASNLVLGDTNGEGDVFVHDRWP